jgi:hypothetical protein
VSVRLQDDLHDGDLDADDLAAAERLVPVLMDEALAVYRVELRDDRSLWALHARAMAAWQAAHLDPGADPADRAAPLYIPAAAICRLTGRQDCWPALKRCLAHALTALVLYDQLVDWEDDLAAGRWNAFVATITPGPQDAAHRERNRAAVLAALLVRGAGATAYARVESESRAAAAIAAELGIEPLRTFLTAYAERTAEQGLLVQGHYDEVADRAVGLFFGTRGPG